MKYVYKTKPRGYQVRALKKVVARGQGGLFMPMRSGKTKVAIDWAGIMHLKHGVRRVLVVTHTPKTFGVWINEIRKHCPLPHRVYVQDPKNCVAVYDANPEIDFLIVNVQRVYDRKRRGKSWEAVNAKWLYKWKPDAIIVDESTTLGDPMSVQSKHLYRLQKKLGVHHKLILTGTPAHRKLWGVFGQMKFLNDEVFGTSITAYKRQYGQWGGYGNWTLLRYVNLKTWRRKLEPYIYQLVRIPSRPPVEQVIPVELSDEEREAYETMRKHAVLTRPDGTTVEAPIVLTRLRKEMQLAAGWIKDEDGEWHRVGTSLRDTFEQLLSDLKDSEVRRVVVFARHIAELRDATEVCREVGYQPLLLHGGVTAEETTQRIAKFHEPGKYKAFVSQISTGSMGIDLSCADTTVYYSLTESLLHKDQADARMRKHKDNRALTYYYLMPKDTIFETQYLALKSGMNLVDFVMKHPSLVHRQERG